MTWVFNKNYEDYNQVERFYTLFEKIHNNITSKGGFAYNSLFEGKLGINDTEQEKTAIYLLQQSMTEKSKQEKINNLIKEGYSKIEQGEGIKKYSKIVQVGTDYTKDSTKEYENVKIVFRDGYPYGILPKGHRTRGIRISPNRLIFAI